MIHLLLVAAVALFILWIIGIAGVWAAHVAWTFFVIACVLLLAWLIVGAATSFFGRRRAQL